MARTVDPLGGSYFVEALTDAIESRARVHLERIAAMGGAAQSLDYMRDHIHRSAYRTQLAVESGERVVVGVNSYVEEGADPSVRAPDYGALEAEQRARLAELRARRDGPGAARALDQVREAARTDANLVPPMVAAVRARATLGEISDVLVREWGRYAGQ